MKANEEPDYTLIDQGFPTAGHVQLSHICRAAWSKTWGVATGLKFRLSEEF